MSAIALPLKPTEVDATHVTATELCFTSSDNDDPFDSVSPSIKSTVKSTFSHRNSFISCMYFVGGVA